MLTVPRTMTTVMTQTILAQLEWFALFATRCCIRFTVHFVMHTWHTIHTRVE